MKAKNFEAGRFPAQIVASRRFNAFMLTETSYSTGQILEKHSHSEPGFIFVLKGEFVEHQSLWSRTCKYSDVIFRPAGHIHGDSFQTDGTTCFNLQFQDSWLSGLQQSISDLQSPDHPLYFSGGALFQLGLKLHKELRIADKDSPLIIEGVALEMIGEACRLFRTRQGSGAPLWLKRMKDRLHSGLTEHLTVQKLAIEAGVHPVYLNRVFQKYFGHCVGEYLRTIRIQFCCTQLASTDLPIAEISAAAGFYDQGHCSRMFKRSLGMTPLAYRRLFRKV